MLFFASLASAQPAGYGYGRRLLLQGGKITGSGAVTDLPVLVDLTDNALRTTANGGHVQNASGYDIVFTQGDCNTVLSFEIESYTASTGHLVAWVLMPSLTPGTNKGIHLYYGKSGVSANPSSAAVWASYHGAWHFQGGSMNDNTGNGYNATNNGTTTQSPARINDGRAVDGTQWMQIGNFPDLTTSFSMSAWIYTTDNTYPGQRVFQDDENNTGGYAMSLGDGGTGMLRFYSRSSDPVILDTPADVIANNTWYYVTAVVDMTARMKYIYVNGSLVASGGYSNAWGTDSGPASIAGETALGETGNRFRGRIDEVRVARTALSAGRVLTEYNSQSAPSSFYALSTEYTANQLCLTLPIELLSFDATNVNDTYVQLKWTTASERDNARFNVERSTDGENWYTVAELPGAGNSQEVLHYSTTDEAPDPGANYYRLRQTDLDGTTTTSDTRVVDLGARNGAGFALIPNPANSTVRIQAPGLEGAYISIRSLDGRLVDGPHRATGPLTQVDIGHLRDGVYLVSLTDGQGSKSARLVVER